jgi:tetratricopeptide (TPR) repeat protein
MQTVTQHGRTAKDRFELVIRLQQSRGSQPSDAGLRLRAQALLKDILMSRLDVEAEINAHEYVHTQGFDDLGRALAASRALQAAFEGFRAVVPAPRANVSVVLDSWAPDESAPAQPGLSVEQKDLLDFAKPSQVLITQAFYDRIAHYQPALRTFPLRAGVYEFLWTSEQRLDELQAEAEFMPTLIQPPPDPEAFEETVVVPVIKPAPEPRWKAPDPAPAPLPVLDFDDEPPARWLSMPKILMITGVVAILLVAGYLVYSGVLGKSTKQVAQSPPAVQPTTVSAPPAPPPAPPERNPRTAPPSGAVKEKAAAPPATTSKPKPTGATPDHPPALQSPASKPARGRNCTLDDSEMDGYLGLAERYRSSGKYDRAITDYTLVLACQPGNREAQAGLRKAEEAEKYSH